MKKILFLEDDENLNRGISLKLTKEGYQVLTARTVAEARRLWDEEEVDMVITDINLPDGSGLAFGSMVREKSDVYLIYLTALDTELDEINGYDSGADDYITKPFSIQVLTQKVHARMRRIDGQEKDILHSGALDFSVREMQVRRDGKPLALSKTEIQLLRCLMENAGRIVSKEMILEQVWGFDGQFVEENTVAVNISRLKSKLGADCIANIRGLGYIWTESVTGKRS